ncbi:MAG: hypothetical protein JWO30_1803 [Fibrobacteres bacterium]|nr:hypothetical protein [Fibrobacterota bacterium]
MEAIQEVKSDLQAWLKEAEKAPNFKTLLQNKYFELRDELEAQGLSFRETEDTLMHPESRTGAHWGEVRSEFKGRGRTFLGMQVGQDWMARFNALCIAYLKAKAWLLEEREGSPGLSGPA